MAAPVWSIVLEEGSDFDLVLVWEDSCGDPIDVTGYGARFGVKNNPTDPSNLVTATVGAGITVAGTTGQFTIQISAASVDAILNLINDEANFTFTIWPGASTPDVNPKRMLQGSVEYSRSYNG